MEDELRESEERFRLIAETIDGAFWMANVPIERMFYISPAYERIWGRTCASLYESPRSFIEAIHAEDRERVVGDLEVQKNGQSFDHEYRIIWPDGTTRWIWDRGYPVRDKTGMVTRYVGIAQDITERKRAEEALRESEASIGQLIDHSPIAMIVDVGVDADEKILMMNKKFTELFGYTMEDIPDVRHWWPVAYPDEKYREEVKAEWIGKVEKAIKNRTEIEPMETRVTCKDGSIRYIKFYLASIGNRNLIAFENLTERKRMEEEKERLLKETDRINKELNDFAYIVSHDLKAPLRAVTQLAEWLNEDYADTLDDAGKEKLELLKKRALRMHGMIEGILQYSRAGRMKGEPQKVDIGMVVRHIIDSLSPPENIRLSIQDGLPQIDIDPLQINQVFQNLISNAIKYMDKPEGLIEVGCIDAGEFHEFFVKDNGPGIEERHFERIFQIFQTLTPKDEFESTGIGLTIVKKIMEQNGGRIWVESEVGKGSIFRFTLPKNITPPTSSPPL